MPSVVSYSKGWKRGRGEGEGEGGGRGRGRERGGGGRGERGIARTGGCLIYFLNSELVKGLMCSLGRSSD
jgi:hypothetical protein